MSRWWRWSVAAIGVFCTFGVFWTLPTAWLSGTAAAGAIALINSIGNLAGFGGPYLIGWVKEATGSTSTGLLVLAVLPLIGGLLVFLGGHETKAEFAGMGVRIANTDHPRGFAGPERAGRFTKS